jgi:hypothetical protein
VLPHETDQSGDALLTRQGIEKYGDTENDGFLGQGSRKSAPRNDAVLASMLPESPFDAARAHRSRRS